MSGFDVLLAKRLSDRAEQPAREQTLVGHTEKVIESLIVMFGDHESPSRLASSWLRFFGLMEKDFSRFWVNSVAACGVHDPGKANDGFQHGVRGKAGSQVIRHEHLSGLLLCCPEIREWLQDIPDSDFMIVLGAVVSHHLKADFRQFAKPLIPDRKRIAVYPEGMAVVLEATAQAMRVDQPTMRPIPQIWMIGDQWFTQLEQRTRRDLEKFRRQMRNDLSLARMFMSVRTALIVADSAGSGLSRENKDIKGWLHLAFREEDLLSGEDMQEHVIVPRIHQLTESGRSFRWNDFQEAAETLGERGLLLAPCGSGKTLAAWRWLKKRLDARPASRVIFLYPTRATASEGFRDYVSWAPEADAALISGTAEYELERMFENPEDSRGVKDFTPEDRLFALGYWPRRIFSATIDQFLGFMQHSYRSTCLMPMLCDSVVVIDEVHSFDQSLFSALKRFLKAFRVPVLCMTASLPRNRVTDLQKCGLEVFPANPADFEDLARAAQLKRYRARRIASEEEARKIAKAAVGQGRRVLWVVNNVDRCQDLAESLGALCYHSRFRLQDRTERHQEVVAAFQRSDRPALAVTTQVCEMSLDLDAQLLISEVSPITSLIQRMGRCNRRAKPDENRLGQVFIYSPPRLLPYKERDMEGVDRFLEAIDGREISQSELQVLLEELVPDRVEVERYAAFLESGPWASSREESLREDQGITVNAILDSDVEQYLDLRRNRRPINGLVLPAPPKMTTPEARIARHLRVAPSIQYQCRYGLRRNEVER